MLKNAPNVPQPPSRYSALLAWFTSRPTRSSLLSSPRRNFAFLYFFYLGPADKSTTTMATAAAAAWRLQQQQQQQQRTASTPPRFVRSRHHLFPRCYYLCTVRGTRHSIIFSSIFTHPPPPPILMSRKCRGEARHGCARVRKTPVRTSRFAWRTCRCNRG